MSEVTYFPELYIFSFLLLILYTIAAAAFEHYKIHFIHESGLAIILGVIVGVIFYFVKGGQNYLTFDEKAFFYFLLPPIIFAAGYNLKRRNFFKNFPYIFIFGILGTIVSFSVILSLTYAVSEAGWIYILYSFNESRNKSIQYLSMTDCLYFAATTCATDTVASLTILKPRKYPKLFSVIFGESTLNDAVAIILFQAIDLLTKGNPGADISVDGAVIGTIIGNFFKIGILSLLIGLLCGLLCALLLKYGHFLRISVIFEISIIFFFGYLSYVICQNIELSGILALLMCGITMAHYAFYNISITSKLATGITFQTVSHAVEGFLFIYIGLVCVFKDAEWSVTLIIAEFFILFLARVANVVTIVILFWPFYKLLGITWDLDVFELLILILAGTIRGAVAFALIQIVYGKNAYLLQVTTYINLMISTILMGALMPHLLKIILRCRDRCLPDRALINQNEVSQLQNEDFSQTLLPQKKPESQKKSNILHSKWRKLDDHYLKPFFIYNYSEVKAEIDYMYKLSVHEIYKVEFNPDAMDYRNPLPYSIKEMDVSQIFLQEKQRKRYKTVGHLTDNDVSIEREIDRDISLRKNGGKVLYPGYENEVFMNPGDSFGSPQRLLSNDELRKQYLKEKMKAELASNQSGSSKKLKKVGKSAESKKKAEDVSINQGDGEDSSEGESPEEAKERKSRG